MAGQAWRDVARHAILAAHAWNTERHAPAEEGGQAWGGIADVAAIAGVLADLDADLAAAATHMTGRTAVADALLRAATAGLALAARETAAAGRRRALCPPDGLESTPPPNRVVVRAERSRPTGRRPGAAGGAAAHGRAPPAGTAAADHHRAPAGMHRPGRRPRDHPRQQRPRAWQRPLAAELRRHARLLLEAGGRRGLAASLQRSDALPIRQAAELYQALHHRQGLIAQIAADPELSRGFAAALVDTTRALAETADRHLGGRNLAGPGRGRRRMGLEALGVLAPGPAAVPGAAGRRRPRRIPRLHPAPGP